MSASGPGPRSRPRSWRSQQRPDEDTRGERTAETGGPQERPQDERGVEGGEREAGETMNFIQEMHDVLLSFMR